MIANLNTEIDNQNTLWASRDAAWFAATGRPDPGFTVEHIRPDNIYSGTIPSLIKSPASNYPNLCVIAYIASPSGEDTDWGERYLLTVALEFMVKSLILEEEVNARIQRTLEAGNKVLTSDENRRIPDFDGASLVPQIATKPQVTISDVFVRHITSDPNAGSFYQHGSLTYRVEKFSTYGP